MNEFVKRLRKNDKSGIYRILDSSPEETIDAVFDNLQRTPEYIETMTKMFDVSCSVSFEAGRDRLKAKRNELKKHVAYIVDFKGTDYESRSAVSNLKCFLGAATVGLQ